MSGSLTGYKRGVALDGSRHATNPLSPNLGMCGVILAHRIGLFQINHPMSCRACIDHVKRNSEETISL